MIKLNSLVAFKKKQFHDQSNIVYLSTMIIASLFIPAFIYIGNPWTLLLTVTTVLTSFISMRLNKVARYGLASLIFIIAISTQTFIEVIFFDFRAGFFYYFFNMTGLIMYTNWTTRQKITGVGVQIVLFITGFLIAFIQGPIIELSNGLLIFFHISNIILNITGVGNSVLYFLKIVDKAQETLSTLALVDQLTLIPNRTAINQHLEDIHVDGTWKQNDIALVMIDIDHFKSFNDTYGHLIGDQILRYVAKRLNHQKRPNDFLARYGGEEFMMLIEVNSPFKLEEILENYRNHIETYTFAIEEFSLHITISLGAVLKMHTSNMTYQKAIEQADKLLYKAKQNGRNCFRYTQINT